MGKGNLLKTSRRLRLNLHWILFSIGISITPVITTNCATSYSNLRKPTKLWLNYTCAFLLMRLLVFFFDTEIRDGEDLWQWPRLEIRLNAFRRSTIPQKQFIIHHHHHHQNKAKHPLQCMEKCKDEKHLKRTPHNKERKDKGCLSSLDLTSFRSYVEGSRSVLSFRWGLMSKSQCLDNRIFSDSPSLCNFISTSYLLSVRFLFSW